MFKDLQSVEKDSLFSLMGRTTLAVLKIIPFRAKGNMKALLVKPFIKEIGKIINPMERVGKPLRMDQITRDSFRMERNMVREYSLGPMGKSTMDNFWMDTCTVKEDFKSNNLKVYLKDGLKKDLK